MDIKSLKKGLIVSCQALEHEPMYTKEGGIMPLFAKAAFEAGAVGIRANSIRDIKQIKEVVNLPIIGIIKKDYPNTSAYITPSIEEVDKLVLCGCDIIATDCTKNTRKDNKTSLEFIKEIKIKYPNQLIMADISCYEDALIAIEAGADFIGTTLSGYVEGQIKTDDPDFELVKKIHENHPDVLIIAEGKIHTPDQALKMLELGAYCVVVGGAITRPKEIALRFVNEMKKIR